MARKTAQGSTTRKPKSPAQAAQTPRQVALMLPHGAASAGTCFESALEVLDKNLAVHKLWQAKPKAAN